MFDEKAFAEAIKEVIRGYTNMLTSVTGIKPVDEAQDAEVGLMLEFDRPAGKGLTRAEASAACARWGFPGQKVGAWATGGFLETRDGLRYIGARGYRWLEGDMKVETKNRPAGV